MSQERREQERLFLDLQARVTSRFTDDTATDFIETLAANISAGGAFLRTERPLPMASKVQVEFLLSFENLKKLKFILSVQTLKQLTGRQVKVRATGVVIRQEEGGVAIIFDQNYQLTPMQSVSD
jgi:hypothetical protein